MFRLKQKAFVNAGFIIVALLFYLVLNILLVVFLDQSSLEILMHFAFEHPAYFLMYGWAFFICSALVLCLVRYMIKFIYALITL